ncbi:hypothetical protein TWF970_009561 [Orbilia oligospora]|uniref:Uncharacterized protein n=1 Tax=Orbilia oligospora TaxID=2813651 RepID=A0A7C8RDT4_ORBOL|nr:hypothetical protein TWF970_009561 [Orbilia oligospora]
MHGTRCLTTLIVIERIQGYKTLGVISRSMARGVDIEITFATSRLTAKGSSRAKLSIFKVLGSIVRTYQRVDEQSINQSAVLKHAALKIEVFDMQS